MTEGYATAASVHEATSRSVAVAFNACNMKAVAKTLRQQAPGALIALCGDDNQDTHRRTGKNHRAALRCAADSG
ncbi:MAG: toprim domain-containing protein [Burkholderiaceae bacterium]|nr:toprim domain-containing protein [Burkholderiaceae bacterium]